MSDKRDDGGPAHVVPLGDGDHAIVSLQDVSLVSLYSWRLGKNGYAYRDGRRDNGTSTLMQRIIMKPPPTLEVHHKNGNKLDNRRENLELIHGPEHRRKHMGPLQESNESRRLYPRKKACAWCGQYYNVHKDHRGVSRFCSRSCSAKNSVRHTQKYLNRKATK